jgi:hypothetical protein
MTKAKTILEVGYLLVDVLRFWHSTVDCASFGLFPEVSLLSQSGCWPWGYAGCIGGGGGGCCQDA